MYEICVNRVNYWSFTCSIKLYKNKPTKVFPITKEEYDTFNIWKFNSTKVSHIMQRKQINLSRNEKANYIYDIAKCNCGYSWIEKVDHIPMYSEYRIVCPKCGIISKKFKQ